MVILYVETNFLMSIAQGQDLAANQLLNSLPESLRIIIPSICFIEALATFEKEKKDRTEFARELDKQINKATRDMDSHNAKRLVLQLEQARILNQRLLNEINYRLYDVIDKLIENAEIINLNNQLLRDITDITLIFPEHLQIKNDLIDNLILQCILNHAKSHTTDHKVFLSENKNDFGKPDVQEALSRSGVRYFSLTQDFLSWLQSQNS
ncbi:PIN domain-containing protein [Anabaena sp. 4-3]|uniref:PIN domain-containing protein n=1 Tax=Anabaena sp. 4-3 TaxID=1811979 RepID=UPI0008332082|nr:PIN domain-containing protein [Anabaena sp. 4-3]